jgi:hypothetical protein
MANNIAAYTPTIIAKTLPILRETLQIQKYVTTDYSAEMATIGNSIQIPVTAQLGVQDIIPSNTAPALTSITPTNVTLTLNKFKQSSFTVTTTDLNTMMKNSDFVSAQLEEAARSMARQIATDCWSVVSQCPYYVGTAGTNPFASNINTLALARQSLNVTLADPDRRVMLLSNAADEGANTLANFTQAYQRGSAEALNTGDLGMLQGFKMVRDSIVPTWTAGTGTSYTMPVIPPALGATSAAIITGTGTIIAGDIFTVAGDTQTYVATNALAAPGTLTFYPPLQKVPGASAAITLAATHINNFGMDPGFMALGMRQPREVPGMLNELTPMIDNQGPKATGMQFFLSVVPNIFAVTYNIGCFYGVTMLRPERGVRMAG